MLRSVISLRSSRIFLFNGRNEHFSRAPIERFGHIKSLLEEKLKEAFPPNRWIIAVLCAGSKKVKIDCTQTHVIERN